MERRDFLKYLSVGGLSLAGANVWFVGCESATDAGDSQQTSQSQTALMKQAADSEAKAIKTYEAAVTTGLLVDQTVKDVTNDFRMHHELHLLECNKLVLSFGENDIDVLSAAPDPRVFNAFNQKEILTLAMEIEFQAATFYFSKIVDEVQNASVRKVFANTMPIEVAHMITYKNVLGRPEIIDGAIFESLTAG